MSPDYLNELADIADPDRLWRLSWLDQMELPTEKRRQLDAGVALRRHASHVGLLRDLLADRRSLLITPLSENGTAVKSVDTPPDHVELRNARDGDALAVAQPAPAAPSELHGDALLAFNQCRAVAHMARSLAEVHDARAAIVAQSKGAPIEVIGESTAEIMEWLGDTLSNMDAVAEDDAWLDPVFEAAHARWPLAAPAAQPADSAMEVLRELVAIKDLQRSRAQAEARASTFPSDENYAVVDKLWSEIARRTEPAWDRARTLSAASNKESQHG